MDRKRRDNINDSIQQLLTMIPTEYFEEFYRKASAQQDVESLDGDTPLSAATPKGSVGNSSKVKGSGTRDGKPNKGQILTQAVEYITRLQNEVDTRNREEVELILKVQGLSAKTGTIVNDVNLENTSAEVALAKIGVGPLAGEIPATSDRGEDAELQETQSISQPPQSQFPQDSHPPPPHVSSFEYGGYSEYGNGN